MNHKQAMPSGNKFDKVTMKRLLSYLTHHKFLLMVVVICIVIGATTGAVASLFLSVLIDQYITPLLIQAVPDFSGMLRVILMMGGVYLIGVLSTLFYNWMMVFIAQEILKKIRDEMFSHMQRFSIRFFDTHSHGDIMSHYTNDIDTLRQMISQSIPQMISAVVTVTTVVVSMLYLSFWLTLFASVFLFFSLRIVKTVAGKSGTHFIQQQRSIGDINGYIEEMIHGQKVIKVFCREEKIKETFSEKNQFLRENATKANEYANILMPLMFIMGYMMYISIAIVGGMLALFQVPNIGLFGSAPFSLGVIASFLQLSRTFMAPISQVTQQINAIIMALAGAQRIFSLLDESPEEDHGVVTLTHAKYENGELKKSEEANADHLWAWEVPHADGSVTYTKVSGEVELSQVDFAYSEDKPVLRDISLYAKPGQKIALVGSTGAGKTTITNLLNRFYDIADGKVRYDGININKIKKQDLRRSLGIVLQDVNLFTGTVMDNIRYGRLDASDEDCIKAAKLANAHNFIMMLPLGYQTEISGDGSNLSQGQKQLISIARAAVADPPVMILDEATSSIDTRTEALVQKGMDSLMHNRTVFVIAHRLSTVKNSDVIMVMEQGEIIERGNHEKLLSEKGRYYQLYTGAFELE